MAKLTLNITTVDGSAYPEREIDAYELLRCFVSDDMRPPANGVWLTLCTDDEQKVHLAIPPDGTGSLEAHVRASEGLPSKAEPPRRLMTILKRPELISIIGEPDKAGSTGDPFGGTEQWACGCYASPALFASRERDGSEIDLEWVQCEDHAGKGPGSLRRAPQRFSPES